jgi:hypothetical protein
MTPSVRPVTPNVPLLRKTLAHIEANPDQWDQSSWINECGTAFCFAGHAVRLHGGRIVESNDDEAYVVPPLGEEIKDTGGWWVREVGGTPAVYIQEYAQELLGLDYQQGQRLFDALNYLHDLRRIVAELCDAAEAVPGE